MFPRIRVVSFAIRLAIESKPQLAMPMNVREPTWPMSTRVILPSARTSQARAGARGHPRGGRKVVAPAAGQDAHAPVGLGDRLGDRRDQSVAAERHGRLS